MGTGGSSFMGLSSVNHYRPDGLMTSAFLLVKEQWWGG